MTPQEFEEALFDPSNAAILDALYVYQKIDRLKGMDEYVDYIKKRKAAVKAEEKKTEPKVTVSKPAKAKKKTVVKNPIPMPTAKPVSLVDTMDETGDPDVE